MTFEDTDNRAPETVVEAMSVPTRRVRRPVPPAPLASRMLDFVGEASAIGGRLEGLALLFRSTFLPGDGCAPVNWEQAAEIVADCMDTMAKSLVEVSMQAHEIHNHETRGGAR